MLHHGSCHCGTIALTVEGEVDTLATPEDAQSVYRFNKHHIAHHFCPTCGCAPYCAADASDGTPTVAINVRCLGGVDVGAIEITAFDGRSP